MMKADLTNPAKRSNLTPTAIQQKLADLRFQQYILETFGERSNCRNQTGKTLAVHAKIYLRSLPRRSCNG
ncbi:MAG: hypothetical protein KME35_17595 [Aphanocapsa sp. GSE-SYN-MK-11-07L]|nr:hypothetical protein [Aphanocapsa sp. GSE-SYN-MK-11-07L]